ncbi:MAG: hypothetical protein LBN43_05910 [Oscillospiraceae bacterium]|jgi:predicted amidophosphoribosyltransferase|nr:hypothetical protein [Oscillospiraceae bacterium]
MALTNGQTSNIIQCKQCGKPFRSAGGKLCSNCLDEIEDGFRKVARYLSIGDARTDPDVDSVKELSDKTETSSWVILQLLREKRITLHKTLEGGLTCQYCHKPIASGDACDDCKNKLSEQLFASKSSRVSPLNPGSTKKYR